MKYAIKVFIQKKNLSWAQEIQCHGKNIKAEALKCMLVCSNCHKEIHYKLGYN